MHEGDVILVRKMVELEGFLVSELYFGVSSAVPNTRSLHSVLKLIWLKLVELHASLFTFFFS